MGSFIYLPPIVFHFISIFFCFLNKNCFSIIRRNDDAALRYRQWTLLNDMSRIYPITLKEEQNQTASKEKEKNKAKEKIKPAKRVLCINGIPLPDADSYAGEDEEQIAAALGMTSRLVLLIAKIFQIELYYTPLPLGSKSLIKEGKSDSNATKFPLYLRGVDLKRFNRAVFLLNKDIEQIAKIIQTYQQDFSLPSTLSNLHTIFVKAAQECKNIG